VAKQKEVVGTISLQITPGAANPSPPVGPALGQRGVNIMEFCKQFNDATKDLDKSMKVPVLIVVFKDKSFKFTVKKPPVPSLILKKMGLKKGSQAPGRDSVGKITWSQIEEIAEMKKEEMLGVSDLQSAMAQVAGTARSMGIQVEEKAE
jgi:large subunit ribosomal protein L11